MSNRCPIPGCEKGCKNLTEHYLNNPPMGRRNEVTTPDVVTEKSVSNKVIVSNTVSNRLIKWRGENQERYREYMREYMKKRRAK